MQLCCLNNEKSLHPLSVTYTNQMFTYYTQYDLVAMIKVILFTL